MPLINPDNTSLSAAHMVEHGFCYFKANAQPLEACCERPPEIKQSPRRIQIATIPRNEKVKFGLALVIAGEPASSRCCKHFAPSRPPGTSCNFVKYGDRKRIEWHSVRLAVLCALAGRVPKAFSAVKFVPRQ